jgi:hypothetical protein
MSAAWRCARMAARPVPVAGPLLASWAGYSSESGAPNSALSNSGRSYAATSYSALSTSSAIR